MDREGWEALHRVLEAVPGASKAELEASYRRLLQRYSADSPEAGRVRAAYEALRDAAPPPASWREPPPARVPLPKGDSFLPRAAPFFAVLACLSLGVGFMLRGLRRAPAAAPAPPPALPAPAPKRTIPAPAATSLDERMRRLEGPLEFDVAGPRGRYVVRYAPGLRTAVDALEFERGTGGTRLEFSAERGGLTGVLQEVPGHRHPDQEDLPFDPDGRTGRVDVTPGPDVRGIWLVFTKADGSFLKTISVRATYHVVVDEDVSDRMTKEEEQESRLDPLVHQCKYEDKPEGGELPEALRALTPSERVGRKPFRVVFAPGAETALKQLNSEREDLPGAPEDVAVAVKELRREGEGPQGLSIDAAKREVVGAWRTQYVGEKLVISPQKVPFDAPGVELAVVYPGDSEDGLFIFGYGPGLKEPVRLAFGPLCWRTGIAPRGELNPY